MANLVVFGAGDMARLAHFYFSTDSEHRVAAFTVDADYRTGDTFQDLPLLPFDRIVAAYPPSACKMFVAVGYRGMNQVRAAKYAEARALGYELVSYVSSRACVLTRFPHGDNCFILEDATVQPFVRVGSNVTLWSGSHICHDSTIGDHCFIGAEAVVSGFVDVGSHCFIGSNATVRNGIRLAESTLVGAGALVMKDTAPRSVYIAARTEPSTKASDQTDL